VEESKNEELISYDDFMKTQLRVAEVIEAEKVPRSEKLLKLKVRLDNEERQVVAGIAKSYEPENLIGKKVVIVANLQPAKLMGLESKGMILAVETSNGSLKVLDVPESVVNGTRVK
jgi:methionyl-tRNA synthetase